MFRLLVIALFVPFAVFAADIRSLFVATPPRTQTVSVTGQVVMVITPTKGAVRDATGVIDLCVPAESTTPLHLGDFIVANGHVTHFYIGLPVFKADAVTVIGPGQLPLPRLVRAGEIVRGERNGQRVRFDGVVTDFFIDEIDHDWCWLLVESFGDKVPVAMPLPKEGLDGLAPFLDAEVAIVGIPMPDAGYRRFLKAHICVASPAAITILKAAPGDPFDVAEFRYAAIDQMRLVGRFEYRRKIIGRVVASWRRRYLFVTAGHEQNTLVDMGRACEIPPSGTLIVASGFLHFNAFHARMDNAVIKPCAAPKSEVMIDPPMVVSAQQLTPHRTDDAVLSKPDTNPILHGKLIRIAGLVRSISDIGTTAALFYLDCDGTTVSVELGDLQPPELGSRVEVTGACVMSVDSYPGSRDFVRLAGATLAPRNQADIRILSGPPWWTPARLMMILGVLLVMIALLVWRNRQRRRREEREALLRIDERTRLAVELHDSLAQNLTGVSLQLDATEMAEACDHEMAHRYLENARNALHSCRAELRYCLGDLRSRSFEDADMTEAVQETVKPHIGKAALFVRFNVPRARFSDSSAHAVLCIIRELVVNAVRHGKASCIHVAGEFVDGTIRFSVRDNGCGFDPTTRPGPNEGHFGLLGVRERLNSFGGTLKIESNKTAGTKVTATLTIHEKDNHPHRGRP